MFKILIVEDDKERNKTVSSFLNHIGYEATGCLNANKAFGVPSHDIFNVGEAYTLIIHYLEPIEHLGYKTRVT